MARPRKNTVDYFPHYCEHKTTMYVLEQRYGNDGYSFWFKILELLGSSEKHFYDCRNPHKWEFLQAKTRLSEDKCNELLNLLAKMDAIDKKLWEQKIIWSENFVVGIAEVYRNRRVETPSKPSFNSKKLSHKKVSTTKKPQSRVENNIVIQNSSLKEEKQQIKDKVVSLFQIQLITKNDFSRIGKVVKDLEQRNATPEQIEKIFHTYKEKWPDIDCTPEAIVKHWDLLRESYTQKRRTLY